jgi:membrane associated rhomboid family serine protease
LLCHCTYSSLIRYRPVSGIGCETAKISAAKIGIGNYFSLMMKILRFLSATPVTTFFALVCIAVYFAMVVTGAHFANPHSRALIEWGGNYRPLTVSGQPWRLLTGMFVHGGWLHLTLNMIALIDIGRLLELKIGRRMQCAIFLLSGLFASLCSVLWHPLSVAVGASGAIMGLAGALLVWLALPKLERAAEIERKVQVRALVLGVTLTLGVGAFSQRIDNAAHAGGLVAGLILGALVYAVDRRHPGVIKRWLAAALLFGAGLLVLAWAVSRQSGDEYKFRKPLAHMTQIFVRYSDVNQFLRQLDDAIANGIGAGPPSLVLRNPRSQNGDLRDQAFQQAQQAWQDCLSLSNQWTPLSLGREQSILGQQIVNYCTWRQQQYQLLWQYDKENRRRNNESAGNAALNQEIGRIVLQANRLSRQLSPALRQQLNTDAMIQAQIGTPTPGKEQNGK